MLARYNEAVAGVPGSGMARPKQELGEIEISLALQLDAPASAMLGLIACYAHTPPAGAVEEEEDTLLEGEEKRTASEDERRLCLRARSRSGCRGC